MAHSIHITARALREIDGALEWLSERSRAAAVRWHEQIMEAVRSLADNPERCP
jgi:plasmid stabilization system protein ParE